MNKALYKKWSFPLSISSVNVTKSAGNCGFGRIYWRNPQQKTSFFVQWNSKNSDLKSLEVTFAILEQNPCDPNPCGSYGNCESTSPNDFKCTCHDNYELKDGECKKKKDSRKLLLFLKQAWPGALNKIVLNLLEL